MNFTLPLPPSKNAIHVRTKCGIALSHKAREWKKQAIVDILMQASTDELEQSLAWMKRDGTFWVRIDVVFPDERKRDAHNVIEILCDALQEATGIDDSHYIVSITDKRVNRFKPRIEVEMCRRPSPLKFPKQFGEIK